MPWKFQSDPKGRPLPRSDGGLVIPFQELEVREGGSPVTSFDWVKGGSCTRVFKINWDDQYDAVWQILGRVDYNQGDKFQTRWLPEIHPLYPWLVASRITSIKGIGLHDPQGGQQYDQVGIDRIARYKYAAITVEYETPQYPVLSDDEVLVGEFERFTKLEWKYNGDYMSLPTQGLMKWSAGPNVGKTFVGQIGKIVGTVDVVMTWCQVAYEGVNFNTLFNALGRVNSKTFWGLDPHSLLLTGVDLSRIVSPYGTWAWTVKFLTKWSPIGHNSFYDYYANPIAPYQVTIDGVAATPPLDHDNGDNAVGKTVFEDMDFAQLFIGP